jgi:hypothetical protein
MCSDRSPETVMSTGVAPINRDQYQTRTSRQESRHGHIWTVTVIAGWGVWVFFFSFHFIFWSFEAEPPLAILLPQPPECRDYRLASRCPALREG